MTAFENFLTALSKASELNGVLGNEIVEFPPSEKVDYWATPQNAVVFGRMGVDGVHYAILKINGHIRDTSPVIQVAPMDFEEPYLLLAPTFTEYLAIGCGVTPEEIEALLASEEAASSSLVDFLRSNFQQSRFWSRGVDLDIAPFAAMIIQKLDSEQSHVPATGTDSNRMSSPPIR